MARRVPQPSDHRTIRRFGRDFSVFCVENYIHCVPVDDDEETRLDELNHIFRQLFGERLVFPDAPQLRDEPEVLDCGFGRGAWIDDFLGEYEDANVTGIDVWIPSVEAEGAVSHDAVETYHKKRWNLNAPFSDDRGDDRFDRNSFDFVHSRCLSEGIKEQRWPEYVRDLKRVLRPEGWLQMCELDLVFRTPTGRQLDENEDFLLRWRLWYTTAMSNMGLDSRVSGKLYDMMRDAGFQHVNRQTFRLPISRSHGAQVSLGVNNTCAMLNAISMWPLKMVPPQMSEIHYRDLMLGARQQLEKSEYRWYLTVYVVWGQKPRR